MDNETVDRPAPPQAETGGLEFRGILRAFKYRNYRLFFGGQGISLIGTWMQSVAQSWLVYRLTGSSLILGLVGFAGQIPVFLLAVFGGVVADSCDRRRIIIWTQTLSMLLAFTAAGLTLSGVIQVWEIFALTISLGLVRAFDIPARQAFVVEMVNREDLHNAIALNSSMFNSARVLGPTLAGILVAMVGEGWCFFLDAVSYIAVIVGLLLMRVTPSGEPRPTAPALARIREGLTYAAGQRAIRSLLLLLGICSILGMPYVVLMPVFANKVLGGGPKALGLLMGSAGLGALLGALILASRRGGAGLGRWVLGAGLGFGISLCLFSFSRLFWLSCLLLLPVGFCMVTLMASVNTLLQLATPDRYRGRVMALYSMMFMGMAPFGALLAGVLAHGIGAPATVLAGGLSCLVVVAVFRGPLLRGLAEQERIAREARD